MSKRDEIIHTYHCTDPHEEYCAGDCKECEKEIAEMLDDFAKEIRADVIDECTAILIDDSCAKTCPYWFPNCTKCMKKRFEALKEKNIK